MAVGDRDPRRAGILRPEASDLVEDEPRVALEQRVDQRELAAVLHEERVDVPSPGMAETVDSGRELGHDRPAWRSRIR